jgi:SPP1 family predicted phage head-tail adaptor
MIAGKLRHRVSIMEDRNTDQQDDYGQFVKEPIEIAEAFVAIEPLSGREIFVARQSIPDATTRITFRWHEGLEEQLNAEQYIEFRGRRLDFLERPRNLNERNRTFELLATERN